VTVAAAALFSELACGLLRTFGAWHCITRGGETARRPFILRPPGIGGWWINRVRGLGWCIFFPGRSRQEYPPHRLTYHQHPHNPGSPGGGGYFPPPRYFSFIPLQADIFGGHKPSGVGGGAILDSRVALRLESATYRLCKSDLVLQLQSSIQDGFAHSADPPSRLPGVAQEVSWRHPGVQEPGGHRKPGGLRETSATRP
jgi:hypothetical protein